MKRFYQIWLIALAVKTVLAIWLPLSNDEAYYWVWGHHPQWSYFDHPPFVGWLFWFGKWIDFYGGAARLPGVWLAHATLLIWEKILAPFLDDKKRSIWLIFVLLSPFFGVGSLIITPDVPLVFFWSLSMWLFLKLLNETDTKKHIGLYCALGASLGLGFCSKYLIVLFVPAALAYLAFSGNWRKVKPALVPLTIFFGLLFCFPVLYWNSQNDWASFRFQLDHGLKSEEINSLWPLEYIGGQLMILFPTVAWFALRRREPREAKFLHYFGWFPLAFFLYTSFKAHVEANWPIMAHPSILALAIINARDLKWVKATMAIWVTALIIVISEVAFQWLPLDPKTLKTSEFTRFDLFLPELQKENVYLGSYQMAAALSYKTHRQIYKLGGMNRRDFYDFLPSSYPNSDTFFVGCEITHPLPAWVTEKGYEIVGTKRLSDEFHFVEVKRRAQGSDR